MDASTPTRHVVLVGLMGSGKTTVGRLVSARLGWPMTDSDAAIEAGEGATVREIGERLGTVALHALEARHLLDALGAPGPSVVCPAASTIDDEACRADLRAGPDLLVWLTASPVTAAERFGHQGHRPRYGDDPAVFLARQAVERDALFRSLNPVELATDGRTPEELADEIVRAVIPRR